MTDGVICDRCNEAVSKTEYKNGIRATAKAVYKSGGMFGPRDATFDLCESCTIDLHDFVGDEIPERYLDREDGDDDE